MILYINNEHCSSVEQLKGYFSEDLTPGSDIYTDLLDYGKHGDIAVWLREMEDPELADKVESISRDLCDSAFLSQLKLVITGAKLKNEESLKPSFDKCFSFEGMNCDMTDKEAKISVSLKVLMCVNEEYELSISSNWGKRTVKINPLSFSEAKSAIINIVLNRITNKELGKINLRIDGVSIVTKTIIEGRNNIEFEVEGVTFKMVCVEGGIYMMGADKDAYSTPVHKVILNSFMCGETPVTQDLWQAVMGNNPSINKGSDIPVNNVSWEDCQKFIYRLNELAGTEFRFLTEAEWEYAARGGVHSKGYIYSGSNNSSEICREFNNETFIFLARVSNDHEFVYPVKKYKSNELGIFDMCGNVLEWCQDYFDYRYNPTPDINPQGPSNGESHVLRGGYSCSNMGSFRKIIVPNKVTWRSPYIDYCFKDSKGLRLACNITVNEDNDSLKPVNVYSVVCKTDFSSMNKNQRYHAAQFLRIPFKNVHNYIRIGEVFISGITKDKADSYVRELTDYGISSSIVSCVAIPDNKSKDESHNTSNNTEVINFTSYRENQISLVASEIAQGVLQSCGEIANTVKNDISQSHSRKLPQAEKALDQTVNSLNSPVPVETKRRTNSLLGTVINYYSKQRVVEVLLENAGVHVGDIVYIKGHTTEKFVVELKEIRTTNGSPNSVKQGRVVTFKVSNPVRKNDKVYLKKGYENTIH